MKADVVAELDVQRPFVEPVPATGEIRTWLERVRVETHQPRVQEARLAERDGIRRMTRIERLTITRHEELDRAITGGRRWPSAADEAHEARKHGASKVS